MTQTNITEPHPSQTLAAAPDPDSYGNATPPQAQSSGVQTAEPEFAEHLLPTRQPSRSATRRENQLRTHRKRGERLQPLPDVRHSCLNRPNRTTVTPIDIRTLHSRRTGRPDATLIRACLPKNAQLQIDARPNRIPKETMPLAA